MHLSTRLHGILFPLIILIGIFSSVLNAETSEPDLDELSKQGLVYVEPTNVSRTAVNGEYRLKPYKERRPVWGKLINFGYSAYEPINHQPNFALPSDGYSQVYGSPSSPLLQVGFVLKRNLPIGSFGADITVGYFQNAHSDPNYVGSKLTIIPLQLGAIFSLDAITAEPYVVPYVGGGGYIDFYTESSGTEAVHGNTMIAPYARGGLAFQLDWLDPRASRVGYEESGIQSSYIYVEADKYFASTSAKDFDFSNTVNWAAGFRIEL